MTAFEGFLFFAAKGGASRSELEAEGLGDLRLGVFFLPIEVQEEVGF